MNTHTFQTVEISSFPDSGLIWREDFEKKIIDDICALQSNEGALQNIHPIAVINRNINAVRRTKQGTAYTTPEYAELGPEEAFLTVQDYLGHLGTILDHFKVENPAVYEQLQSTPLILTIEDDPNVNYESRKTLYDLECVQIDIVPSGIDTFSREDRDSKRPGLNDHMRVRLKQDLTPNEFHTKCEADFKSLTEPLMRLFNDHNIRSGFIIDANLTGFSLGSWTSEFYGYVIVKALIEAEYGLNIGIMTSDVEVQAMTELLSELPAPNGSKPEIRQMRKLDLYLNHINIKNFVDELRRLNPAPKS